MRTLKVEHELHRRRLSRNVGLGVILVALMAVVFGLTIAKISAGQVAEGYDHVVRPELAVAEE